MIHKLDKKTIKRIVDLHQEQNNTGHESRALSFPILGERFELSTSRINQIIRYHREKQQDTSDKTFKVSPYIYSKLGTYE